MYDHWISLALQNFGLLMLIIAFVLSLLELLVQKIRHRANAAETFFHWIVLLPLGFTAIYAFIMHAFFPSFTAATIGWQNSPFQFEVAMANLGFGLIAIGSFRGNHGFRAATVIGNTCWLWGDAAGHIYQMITHNNFALGNAGSWLWMDIIVPILLLICLRKLNPVVKSEESDQYQGPQARMN